MEKTSGTLLSRVISAVVAGGLLLLAGIYGGRWGLMIVSTAAIILGVIEFSRMAFSKFQVSSAFLWLFGLICFVLYASFLNWPGHALLFFALANCFFLTGSLWISRNAIPNERLLSAMAMGSLGLLYCVSLPVFAVKLTLLEQGPWWFLFLLMVVFFGDTFAYFGGRFFGKRKLMPWISPNKTIEGAICGLIGSCIAGASLKITVFHSMDWICLLAFCLVCGFVAQAGDLLMSLVKRVAQVKDSGGILPGHGGILDRLDGIYIACPLVYMFALFYYRFPL